MVMSMLTATPQMAGSRDQGGRVALTRDEVMTASEVAELLHLPVSTVYYFARRGELTLAAVDQHQVGPGGLRSFRLLIGL